MPRHTRASQYHLVGRTLWACASQIPCASQYHLMNGEVQQELTHDECPWWVPMMSAHISVQAVCRVWWNYYTHGLDAIKHTCVVNHTCVIQYSCLSAPDTHVKNARKDSPVWSTTQPCHCVMPDDCGRSFCPWSASSHEVHHHMWNSKIAHEFLFDFHNNLPPTTAFSDDPPWSRLRLTWAKTRTETKAKNWPNTYTPAAKVSKTRG
jgi:hypothetical protein